MIKVILESPYAGNIKRNVRYAQLAVRDSLLRGESPIASHLLYTQPGILNDDIPEERKLGIDAGLAWKSVADKHVFYVDFGYSKGMWYAKKFAVVNKIPIEERRIIRTAKFRSVKTCKQCTHLLRAPYSRTIVHCRLGCALRTKTLRPLIMAPKDKQQCLEKREELYLNTLLD